MTHTVQSKRNGGFKKIQNKRLSLGRKHTAYSYRSINREFVLFLENLYKKKSFTTKQKQGADRYWLERLFGSATRVVGI